ncbi:hypothetical protein KAR91_35730 [Candidatus Pacearchaeota archaeon]|nr:hypothetical protein [Candidatus Pacearchaeota archaeon]
MKLSNWLTEQEIVVIASIPENRDPQFFHDLKDKMTSTLIGILDSQAGESTEIFEPTKTFNQWLKDEGRICPLVIMKNAFVSKNVNKVEVLDTLDEVLQTCHCPVPCM